MPSGRLGISHPGKATAIYRNLYLQATASAAELSPTWWFDDLMHRSLQRRTKKPEQTFRILSKTYRNPEMFFDHNRAGKWRSRHDSATILHEISARIFLVKSDTPFCSVAGWCSQETSVKYIRNRRNVMNMSSTKIENGGFGLKLCGNECRSNHTSFRTGLDPKYSYKKV